MMRRSLLSLEFIELLCLLSLVGQKTNRRLFGVGSIGSETTGDPEADSHVQVSRGWPCRPWTNIMLLQIIRKASSVFEILVYSAIGSNGFSGSYNKVAPVLFTLATFDLDDYIYN